MKRSNKTSIAAELAVHGRVVQCAGVSPLSTFLISVQASLICCRKAKQQPNAVNLGDTGSALCCILSVKRGRDSHLSYLFLFFI